MKYYFNVLKKYASFNGRARRSEYWYFFLFSYIFQIALHFIGGLAKFPQINSLYILALFLPAIAVGVRRMHDTGRSGWFLLVPIYNFILLLTAGVEGTNHYGPDPKKSVQSIQPPQFNKEIKKAA